MNPLLLGGLLISSIVALVAAGGVLVRNHRSAVHWWIASFLLFAVMWSGVVNLQDATRGETYNLTVIKLTFIFAVMMLYAMVRFTLAVTGKKAQYLVVVLTALSVVVVGLIWGGLVVSGVKITHEAVAPVREPLYVVVAAFLLSLAVIGLVVLVMGYQKARHTQRGLQLAVVFIGLLLGVLVGALTNIILPNLAHTIDPARFGWVALVLWTAVLLYAVARHRFLDIRAVVVRTMAYFLVIVTLSLVYYLAVMIVFSLLSYTNISLEVMTAINAGIAVLLAFIFQPLKQFFDKITNSIFYRERYSREEFYARLNEVLTSSIELQPLLRRTATLLADTFGAEQVFFAVPEQLRILNVGSKGHGKIVQADFDWLLKWWQRPAQARRQIVVRSRIDEEEPDSVTMRRMLRSYGVQISLILRQAGEVRGLLFIGDRRSTRYTPRDFSVLETISNELTIAIQNAMSLREVQLLNETLQQRIDEATSELRRSNAQLRKLDEAKDEFISMASHQLRTPLTSVKGYIDMMLEGDAGEITDMQRKFLSEAYVSSERMVHLINDFLNVSRLQTGKFVIDKRPVDLARLVAEELDSLKVNAAGRNLSFSYTSPKNIPPLMLDEAKVRQVVMNFADNAIYYSMPDTVIRVALVLDGDEVRLTVKDTGIGVPESEQEHLFTKFYRASNARRQRPDGTGVGLYLAKRVIVAHGGHVIFESKEGKGSTFGFSLPVRKLRVDESAER